MTAEKAIEWAEANHPHLSTSAQLDVAGAYMDGHKDALRTMAKEVKEIVTIPDHMNAAIAEGEENRRQELKEKKERFADYSDQEG